VIFTFSLSIGAMALIALTIVLFVGMTLLCWLGGLFDGAGGAFGCDTSPLFIAFFFAIGWALPSLAAWAVWATWFRGAA
jgi:hypothetical protein